MYNNSVKKIYCDSISPDLHMEILFSLALSTQVSVSIDSALELAEIQCLAQGYVNKVDVCLFRLKGSLAMQIFNNKIMTIISAV